MAFTDSADMGSPTPDAGAGDPSAAGGAGAAGAGAQGPPPPGGGPILAALARRSLAPQVSTPGPGNMAQGLMMLKQAVEMIHAALPNLEPGSQPHKDAVRALTAVTRHLPQGAPTAGVQQTQLNDMQRSTKRNALLQMLMQRAGQQGGGQGGGAQQGQPPGMPQQPAPATPLPGA